MVGAVTFRNMLFTTIPVIGHVGEGAMTIAGCATGKRHTLICNNWLCADLIRRTPGPRLSAVIRRVEVGESKAVPLCAAG